MTKNNLFHSIISVGKRVLPKKLLYRFILIILLPLLLLQALLVTFFFDRHWDTISHRLAKDVVGEIETVAEVIQSEKVPMEYMKPFIDSIGSHLSLKITYIENKKINFDIKQQHNSEIQDILEILEGISYPFTVQKAKNAQTKLSLQLNNGVLETYIPRKRFFSSTVYVFIAWIFGFSILLFGIAFLFIKNQVRAMMRLARAAEQFGRGQKVDFFKPEGATEVRQAGVSFIQMKNRIQRYLTERTGMLSGVSHDLRTPLTRMKLQLSMMNNIEGIEDLKKDVTEMEHMLEAYLSFARGEGKEKSEDIEISGLLNDLVEKFIKLGQKIDYHPECSLFCLCRKDELIRAITNILSNSKRYAKRTSITLSSYHDMARIIIDDDGPGIPKEKRADVFRAFYRIESSRNTSTGGVGLGLTIAKDIIVSHGGSIELEDSPMKGLRVILMLPQTKIDKDNVS